MILKMNFNFNFKDMPGAAGASIRGVTNARDRHRMAKSGIKRAFAARSAAQMAGSLLAQLFAAG